MLAGMQQLFGLQRLVLMDNVMFINDWYYLHKVKFICPSVEDIIDSVETTSYLIFTAFLAEKQ